MCVCLRVCAFSLCCIVRYALYLSGFAALFMFLNQSLFLSASLQLSVPLSVAFSLCLIKRHCPLTKQTQLQHSHTHTHTPPGAVSHMCDSVCVSVCVRVRVSCSAPHLGPLMYAIKLKCGAELVVAAKHIRGARARGSTEKEMGREQEKQLVQYVFFLVQANLHFRYTCNIVATIALSTPSRLLSRLVPHTLPHCAKSLL